MTCTYTRKQPNDDPTLTVDTMRQMMRKVANLYYHASPYVGEPGQAYVIGKEYSAVDKPVVILHPQDEKRFLRWCAEHNIVAVPLKKEKDK